MFSEKKGPQKFFSDILKSRTKKSSSKMFFMRFPKTNVCKKIFERSTKFEQLKKTAVLEPRTGQFSRT